LDNKKSAHLSADFYDAFLLSIILLNKVGQTKQVIIAAKVIAPACVALINFKLFPTSKIGNTNVIVVAVKTEAAIASL
jgi:hypothetical protein